MGTAVATGSGTFSPGCKRRAWHKEGRAQRKQRPAATGTCSANGLHEDLEVPSHSYACRKAQIESAGWHREGSKPAYNKQLPPKAG